MITKFFCHTYMCVSYIVILHMNFWLIKVPLFTINSCVSFLASKIQNNINFKIFILIEEKKNSTPMGFEPTRAEPIGLAVQRLNHSATASYIFSFGLNTNSLYNHDFLISKLIVIEWNRMKLKVNSRTIDVATAMKITKFQIGKCSKLH